MEVNQKIGIFGGSFNPIHFGHLNSMLSVADFAGLSTIKVVPACQSPFKVDVREDVDAQDRLEMLQLSIREYPEVLEIDEREIKRSGVSYTIDTILEFEAEYPGQDLYLIIGADQLEDFDRWKDYTSILDKVHLLVTSRPGSFLPLSKKEFPGVIPDMIAEFDGKIAVLNNGKTIELVKLDDKDVSASEIRKRLRTGKGVSEFLDAEVERYIKEQGLYNSVGERVSDYKEFSLFCASVLDDAKGIDTRAYDLVNADMPSDFSVIASGTSNRHTSALAQGLVKKVREEYGVSPYSVEGEKEGRWVVVDYGNLIVHLFYDYVRTEYSLETLWEKGTQIMLPQKEQATR